MSEISRLDGEKKAGEVEGAKKVSAMDQLVQFNGLLMKENEVKRALSMVMVKDIRLIETIGSCMRSLQLHK